jgi:integrase/recombinase XerC
MLPAFSDCTRLLEAFLAGRNPRTLAAYQADLEDFRRFMEAPSVSPPTVAMAVAWLLDGPEGLANIYVLDYRSEMSKRGLQITTINRRLATLRSLIKLANTHGLVTWTLPVENVPVPPYSDTCGPDRDGFRAMLDAAGAQPGPKGLRDVALLHLLHDLGLRRSEAVRLDVDDVNLPGNRISIPGKGRAPRELVSLPEPTRAALAAWLEARGSKPGPLFINFDRAGKGHRLTGAAVYHIVGWLGAKAGLVVRPHGLRHLGCEINGGLRGMSDLATLEAGMMRDQSSVDAAPTTLRAEESQPGLDPNNPGAAPDAMLGHQRQNYLLTCSPVGFGRVSARMR